MSILSSIAAHFSPVYRIASAYYKTRLLVLREPDTQKRGSALAALNQVQPTLYTLESSNISYFERNKMISTIKAAVQRTKIPQKKTPAPKTPFVPPQRQAQPRFYPR